MKKVTSRFARAPIPEIKPIGGWRNVPIEENREILKPLNKIQSGLIEVDPQYYKRGIKKASQVLYARESVIEKLTRATKLLPPGYKLVIWDAWRPKEVQQSLFNDFLDELRRKNPKTDEQRLTEMTQTYVSLPSTDPSKPAPHYTGGAIDLTVEDENGKLLDMGTPFDHFGPEATTRYFEDNKTSTTEQRDNRRLLYNIMIAVGFSGYDEEWWHFDFGNQFDAKRTEKPYAVYGPTNLKGVN